LGRELKVSATGSKNLIQGNDYETQTRISKTSCRINTKKGKQSFWKNRRKDKGFPEIEGYRISNISIKE
jgi:hypothetical protein